MTGDSEGDDECLFVVNGEIAHPQPIGRGPWDHGFMHGGAVCGLAAHLVEDAVSDHFGVEHPLVGTRLTVEIMSMVPLAPLAISAVMIKPGRRSAIAAAEIRHDGRLLVRASSHWAASRSHPGQTDGHEADRPDVPPRPVDALDPGADEEMDYPRPGFNCDAVELRSVRGTTEDPGPGLIWVRLRPAVVADRAVTPFTRAATISDLGIAIGWEHSPSGEGFINSDVTLQLSRPVQGPWLCLDSRIHGNSAGTGFCESILSDDHGVVGRVLQSLVETPHQLGAMAQKSSSNTTSPVTPT